LNPYVKTELRAERNIVTSDCKWSKDSLERCAEGLVDKLANSRRGRRRNVRRDVARWWGGGRGEGRERRGGKGGKGRRRAEKEEKKTEEEEEAGEEFLHGSKRKEKKCEMRLGIPR
jgi:hypothetical protein